MTHQGEPELSLNRKHIAQNATFTSPHRPARSQRAWLSVTIPRRCRIRFSGALRLAMVAIILATLIAKVNGEAVFGPHVYELKPWTGGALTGVIFDRSEPPLMSEMRLRMRDSASSTTETSYSETLPSSISAPTTTTASKATSTQSQTIQTASETTPSALPAPFDANVGANFSSPSCSAFFEKFLTDPAFTACHPLSLMLQTSNSFFKASQSLTPLTQTLDASCNADFATCSSLMARLARQIKLISNCQQDAALGNPVVLQAYNGFTAYEPLYHVGCMKSSGRYCYADAITNSSATTGGYVYYLPLGVNLPAGTRPTCNTCLQNTMAVFQSAAGSSSSALATTYGPAAQMIDIGCGPSFIAASVQNDSARAASGAMTWRLTIMLSAMVALSNIL